MELGTSTEKFQMNTSLLDNSTEDGFADFETVMLLHDGAQVWTNTFSIPTVACGALMSCVAAAGIIGNIFNAYVFSKRSMGNASIGVLLVGLSAVDALLLFVAAPLFASSAIYVYRPSLRLMTFIAYMTAYAYPLASSFQTASVWLMMVATLERWIGVCHPFLARRLCTRSRAQKTVAAVLIVSLAYNACRFWEYQPMPVGAGYATVALPCLRQNPHYIRIYVHWMYFVFIFAIPFLVLSLVNGMVVLTIQKAKRDRRQLTRQQRKEHATAALMVIVACAYITCNSLAFVLNAMELWGASGMHEVELPGSEGSALLESSSNVTASVNSSDLTDNAPSAEVDTRIAKRHSNFFYFLIDLNNLLVMIHCSVNFLIYYKFSQRFRAHVQMYIFDQGQNEHTVVDGEGFESRNNSRRGSRPPVGSSADDSRDRKSLKMLLPMENGRQIKRICRNSTSSSFDISVYVPNHSPNRKRLPISDHRGSNLSFSCAPRSHV